MKFRMTVENKMSKLHRFCFLVLLVANGFSQALTQSNITLIGSVSNYVFSLGVFNDSATWFEASDNCKMAGYQKVLDFKPDQHRIGSLSEFLMTNKHPLPSTFWIGFFRPYPQILKWYHSKTCKLSDSLTSNLAVSMTDGQCAAMMYDSSGGYESPNFVARDCNQAYPFICYTFSNKKLIVNYTGYSVDVDNSTVKTTTYSINATGCEGMFTNHTNRPVFMYNYSSSTCYMFDIANGLGQGQFNLTFNSDNTTVKFKDGTYSVMYDNLSTSNNMGPGNSLFPDCKVFPIPEGYCPCELPGNEFEKILKDLEIDESSTGKEKSRYQCAPDGRAYSKVAGSVGIIIICLVFGSICFSDLNLLINKVREWMKKSKRKQLQMVAASPD